MVRRRLNEIAPPGQLWTYRLLYQLLGALGVMFLAVAIQIIVGLTAQIGSTLACTNLCLEMIAYDAYAVSWHERTKPCC
jgi:hypothetical protein